MSTVETKLKHNDPRLSVAPMMAWTDKHCRFLHRLFAPDALLFTEMVTTGALVYGDRWSLLDYNPQEHPVALQLGGNDPQALARCTQAAAQRGYDEVNLNVGCPSDRVQNGAFGACLMRTPELVGQCMAEMQAGVSIPVTVKCRLGVDDHDSDEALHEFVSIVSEAGCKRIYLHARKAILAGLTPAQNRDIPPLQPERVRAVKEAFPELEIVINGGIADLDEIAEMMTWADGVMIGRAAYHHPDFLAQANEQLYGTPTRSLEDIIDIYRDYAIEAIAQGERLHSVTRHLLHAFNGRPGARKFRRTLSDSVRLKSGDITILDDALASVMPRAA